MTKLAEQLKQGADRAWESLSEGWRELSSRASGALTRFRPAPAADTSSVRNEGLLPFGGWAFMTADVFDDDDKVIVRVDAPGLLREDFNVELHDDVLTVWGEKQFDREAGRGRYSVVQCTYGSSAAKWPCRYRSSLTRRRPAIVMACSASNSPRRRRHAPGALPSRRPETSSVTNLPVPPGRPSCWSRLSRDSCGGH